jgi:probable HAF family extracellular repeat protein
MLRLRQLGFSLTTIGILCFMLAFTSPTVAQTYTITDIGTLGGTYSAAFSINDYGEVVGYSATADGEIHAFRYFNGTLLDLNTLGGEESYAYAITDSGIVLGDSRTFSGKYHPFMGAPNSPLFDLGEPYLFSSARAANNADQVVGFRLMTDEHGQLHKRAYLYDTHRMIDLGTFGGKQSDAAAINDTGQVVGHLYTEYHDGYKRAVLYDGSKAIRLGTLGGNASVGVAINNAGQVVGYAELPGGDQRAFLYTRGGKMRNLGTLPGGTQSFAYGINNQGQVVGASDAAGISLRAFIYNGRSLQDLNKLIPSNSGWLLTEARAINNSGQIVGYGIIKGQQHAFLLTPATPNTNFKNSNTPK